jgi:hypothetical protein
MSHEGRDEIFKSCKLHLGPSPEYNDVNLSAVDTFQLFVRPLVTVAIIIQEMYNASPELTVTIGRFISYLSIDASGTQGS